ncbi:MAG: OmpA family protein [Nitrospirae bacterium]|nr:OmpA family protein [Candidatus Manganitrophaceae bacterium]
MEGSKRERTAAQRRSPAASVQSLQSLVERSKSSIDIDSNWLITLSDVLSLLLVFFITFIVISKTAVKPALSASEPADRLSSPEAVPAGLPSDRDRILEEMRSEIKKLNLEKDVSIHPVNKGMVITLKEKVTFRPGEAEALVSSEPILDQIARLIQRNPSLQIEIEGHTDNLPINTPLYPSNWELSVARATNVLKYFITRHNIAPSRLSVQGSADQRPIASNDTPEERALNRRVEIRLKEKDPRRD